MAKGDKTETAQHDGDAGVAEPAGAGHRAGATELVRALHRATRKLEHARIALAETRAALREERSVAQDRLRRMQDLQAEVFRLRDRVRMARLETDEAHGQRVDVESTLHREQTRVVELQASLQDIGHQLRQVLATHARDGGAWQAELERMHAVHERDTAAWQAQVAGVRALHEHDNAVWQAELARVRALHEHDNAVWQAEAERLRAEVAERSDEFSRRSGELSREVSELKASLAAARRPAGALRALRDAVLGRLQSGAQAPPGPADADRHRDD